ncbi:MAG: cytochrome C, partial [Chlorobi bacterium]|nr:cytochrome C [Chlorobiota bacterium]
MKHQLRVLMYALFISLVPYLALSQNCVTCHKIKTPNIVTDWQISKHSKNEVTCDVCHGDEHNSPKNISKAKIPTPETCAQCHEDRVEQFKKGKHAYAWAAMNAMPTIHWQPMELTQGMKGCGGCHKIGLKSEEDIKKLKEEGSGY